MAPKMHKFYKYCVVPQCGNTTVKTPNKMFIFVPNKIEMRTKWLRLAGRDPDGNPLARPIYFCEDHFDLPNDMKNYMKYHTMGYVSKIRLKRGCIPTKFPCKRDRSAEIKRTHSSLKRNIQFKANNQKSQIMKECLSVGTSACSQLPNTLTGIPTDTDPTKYDKIVDVKCEENYTFLYEVVKEEIYNDGESCSKSFNKVDAKSLNKEIIKHTDGNKDFGYISKVETIANQKQNYTLQHTLTPLSNGLHNDTLNSQELNFCSDDRDNDSSFSREVNADIKKETEDETEENQEVKDYISKIDIHEHEVVVNSEDHNPESDTKPSINHSNDTVTAWEVNDGSINLNTDDDVDIKPVIIPDIDNPSQELDELPNSNIIRESEEGHRKTIDDNLAVDTKPLITQGVNDTGEETNELRNLEDVTNFTIEKREFMNRNAIESAVFKRNIGLKTFMHEKIYNDHNMRHIKLNCTHTEINDSNMTTRHRYTYHQYNAYEVEELHSNNQTTEIVTEIIETLNERETTSRLNTSSVNNKDNDIKEHIVAVNRYRKRDSKSSNRKRNIPFDTDDPLSRMKEKDDDLNKRDKTKKLKAKRPNFKKPIRNSFKISHVNPKIETLSEDKPTILDSANLKFGLLKLKVNHEIDSHNLDGHLNIENNDDKYGDNHLEYKYSCIICNYRTNIKKWMESHASLHLDKDTDNILVCDHCDYITKVKFRLIKHMKAHMNEVRYKCKMCPYKCKYSYNLISHMTTHIEKPLSCSICDYKCAHKRLLNNHLKTHTDQKPFQCDHCDYRSSLKQYLVRHIRTHTGEKPYLCKLCEAKFAWSGDLAKHLRIHSNDKPHSCDICAYKTVDKQTLAKHMRIHSSEKPFTCKYCPYSSSMKSNLRTHLRIHSDERPYSCKLCSYTSKQYNALTLHIRTHTKEKRYICKLCDYRATQKTHLNRHLMRHTGEKPFACNICSYKCSRKGSLADHMKTHTSSRPHSCELCEYRCARKSLLVLHMRTHTGEKPYSCDQCDFKCARGSNLYSHKLTHSGVKPYTCGVCNKKLSSKSGLNKHKICHTGEKPYACELCEYKVTKKTLLTLHMSTHKS